jgi:hypothetical protein
MHRRNFLFINALAIVTPLVLLRYLPGAEAEKASGGSGPVEKKSEVKLLEPGAEPYRPLRYRFKAGATEAMTVEMRMKMSMAVGERQQQPMVMPTTRSHLRMDQKEVTPEGNLRYEYGIEKIEVVEEPGVNPMILQVMKSALAGMEGLKGRGLMTTSGVNLETDVEAPPNASPQIRQFLDSLKQSLRNVSAQFPEEPIGKGGRWKVVQLIESPGAAIVQTATYKVVEMEGDRVTLDVAIEQSASDAPAKEGAQAQPFKLKSLDSKGAGTSRIDLARMLPRSEMKISTTSDMETGSARGGMKMRMQMEMDVRISPEEAKAAPAEGKDAPKPDAPPADTKGKEAAPK